MRPTLIALALAVCASTGFAQDTAPTGMVVDANGAAMGPLYMDGVLVRVNGALFKIPLRSAWVPDPSGGKKGFLDPRQVTAANSELGVYYESIDCSGQGFIPLVNSPGLGSSLVLANGSTRAVLLVAEPAPIRLITQGSFLRVRDGAQTCGGGGGFVGSLLPVTSSVDLSTLFAAPYRIQ